MRGNRADENENNRDGPFKKRKIVVGKRNCDTHRYDIDEEDFWNVEIPDTDAENTGEYVSQREMAEGKSDMLTVRIQRNKYGKGSGYKSKRIFSHQENLR